MNRLSKNTLLDNRFSARRLRRSFGAPPINILRNSQGLQNDYEIQPMAFFPAEKSVAFQRLKVADIYRKLCDLRSETQISPAQEWPLLWRAPNI